MNNLLNHEYYVSPSDVVYMNNVVYIVLGMGN